VGDTRTLDWILGRETGYHVYMHLSNLMEVFVRHEKCFTGVRNMTKISESQN